MTTTTTRTTKARRILMSKPKVELFNYPPVGTMNDWEAVDSVLLVLIDHPGKWALVAEQKRRNVQGVKARGGLGFKFKTHENKETGLIEVWGSYHPL